MLVIKLRRIGKKHQPSYRLIVQEKREKLGGRYAEDLGWYNPLQKKREFNKERIQYWLKIGVKPTDTVYNMLVSDGLISGAKRPKHSKPKAVKEENKAPEVKAATTPAAEKKAEA